MLCRILILALQAKLCCTQICLEVSLGLKLETLNFEHQELYKVSIHGNMLGYISAGFGVLQ